MQTTFSPSIKPFQPVKINQKRAPEEIKQANVSFAGEIEPEKAINEACKSLQAGKDILCIGNFSDYSKEELADPERRGKRISEFAGKLHESTLGNYENDFNIKYLEFSTGKKDWNGRAEDPQGMIYKDQQGHLYLAPGPTLELYVNDKKYEPDNFYAHCHGGDIPVLLEKGDTVAIRRFNDYGFGSPLFAFKVTTETSNKDFEPLTQEKADIILKTLNQYLQENEADIRETLKQKVIKEYTDFPMLYKDDAPPEGEKLEESIDHYYKNFRRDKCIELTNKTDLHLTPFDKALLVTKVDKFFESKDSVFKLSRLQEYENQINANVQEKLTSGKLSIKDFTPQTFRDIIEEEQLELDRSDHKTLSERFTREYVDPQSAHRQDLLLDALMKNNLSWAECELTELSNIQKKAHTKALRAEAHNNTLARRQTELHGSFTESMEKASQTQNIYSPIDNGLKEYLEQVKTLEMQLIPMDTPLKDFSYDSKELERTVDLIINNKIPLSDFSEVSLQKTSHFAKKDYCRYQAEVNAVNKTGSGLDILTPRYKSAQEKADKLKAAFTYLDNFKQAFDRLKPRGKENFTLEQTDYAIEPKLQAILNGERLISTETTKEIAREQRYVEARHVAFKAMFTALPRDTDKLCIDDAELQEKTDQYGKVALIMDEILKTAAKNRAYNPDFESLVPSCKSADEFISDLSREKADLETVPYEKLVSLAEYAQSKYILLQAEDVTCNKYLESNEAFDTHIDKAGSLIEDFYVSIELMNTYIQEYEALHPDEVKSKNKGLFGGALGALKKRLIGTA